MAPNPYNKDSLWNPASARPVDGASVEEDAGERVLLYTFLTAAIAFGVIAFVRVVLSMGA